MAAITVADWTVRVLDRQIHHKERVVRAALTLANGGTYPSSGGMALPSRGQFGMTSYVSSVVFYEEPVKPSAGNGVVWKYASTSKPTAPAKDIGVLRGFWSPPTAYDGVTGLSELPTTWFPSFLAADPGPVFYVEVKGW